MPVAYQDKPIELLREEVIDQLIMNYGHGEISLEAFERRLDEAYATGDHDVLHALTSDLTLEADQAYARRKQQQLGVHYANGEPEDVDYPANPRTSTTWCRSWAATPAGAPGRCRGNCALSASWAATRSISVKPCSARKKCGCGYSA
jgi:hypothetical protein